MGELQKALEEFKNAIDDELIKVNTNTQLYHNEEFLNFIKALNTAFESYIECK